MTTTQIYKIEIKGDDAQMIIADYTKEIRNLLNEIEIEDNVNINVRRQK